MQYYGTRLSENISRREPEGYLLCLNVPVARTGTQEYLPEELGLPQPPPGLSPSGLIPVDRPESEVFAPETLASFEGMPVTNDHPTEGVDIENIRRLQMGHAHNVRRGAGEESDLLLADLIITDPRLIDAILAGKREISCGYTYELREENGRYIQRKIRGNHIAVVDAGRAGPRVSIKDNQPERSTPNMKKSLTKLLARMAKDGDVETVAEFIEEMIGDPAETPSDIAAVVVATPGTAPAAEPPASDPAPAAEDPAAREITVDAETAAAILERLDRLIALLTPAADPAADEDPAPDASEEIAEAVEEIIEAVVAEGEEAADPAPVPAQTAESVAALVEEILSPDPDASTVLEDPADPDDPDETDCTAAARNQDALKTVLAAFRPALMQMNRKQRRKVSGDLAAQMRRLRGGADAQAYAALRAAPRRPQADPKDLGRRIMEARNANYQKH